MAAEGFFSRWARVKAEAGTDTEPASSTSSPVAERAPVSAPASMAPTGADAPALPTLADAAALTPDADFSAFVGNGVDQAVRRLALKTLFSDPHFNLMDGLDMYMDDYNIASPVSAEMLASLDHARSALRQPQQVLEELARLAGKGGVSETPVIAEKLATDDVSTETGLAAGAVVETDPGADSDSDTDATAQVAGVSAAPQSVVSEPASDATTDTHAATLTSPATSTLRAA